MIRIGEQVTIERARRWVTELRSMAKIARVGALWTGARVVFGNGVKDQRVAEDCDALADIINREIRNEERFNRLCATLSAVGLPPDVGDHIVANIEEGDALGEASSTIAEQALNNARRMVSEWETLVSEAPSLPINIVDKALIHTLSRLQRRAPNRRHLSVAKEQVWMATVVLEQYQAHCVSVEEMSKNTLMDGILEQLDRAFGDIDRRLGELQL